MRLDACGLRLLLLVHVALAVDVAVAVAVSMVLAVAVHVVLAKFVFLWQLSTMNPNVDVSQNQPIYKNKSMSSEHWAVSHGSNISRKPRGRC